MKIFTFLISIVLMVLGSCTLDKTDYEAEINNTVPEYHEFKEFLSINKGIYKIKVLTINGSLYRGYNEIRLQLVDTDKNESVSNSNINLIPSLTHQDGSTVSYPHSSALRFNSTENYYSGYAVFGSDDHWDIRINITANQESFDIKQEVTIQKQVNKNLNMTTFIGNDGHEYIIALKAPQKPKVSENQLVAGIYRSDNTKTADVLEQSNLFYAEAVNYSLLLDPRMPEPSMGNHSSPNNQNLTQQADGMYYGVVNYTMTGNWTLNFILLNESGKIIKGTPVSTDFTPGVEGIKSELHIDILF